MLTPSLPHVHFSDTCSLGSNGSTKFLESLLSLIPFQRAGPALVLECYVNAIYVYPIFIKLDKFNQNIQHKFALLVMRMDYKV
jgi:hypothetical protein